MRRRLNGLSRLGRLLMLGGVFLLLALLVFFGWTWRHPSAFEKPGAWGVGNTDWQVGQTAYVPMTFPGDHASGSVRIHGGNPRGLADSTDARFTYFLCTPDGGPPHAEIGIDTESRLKKHCVNFGPATNETMSLTEQQLIVGVTPNHEGVVAFHGLDLRYSDGWQYGTQLVGGDVRIRVRP
jgi:hypothetical protein